MLRAKRSTRKRPGLELVVKETKWAPWKEVFSRHHYLPDAGPMGFSTAYTGFIEEEPVAFIGVSGMVTGKGKREARLCRFVVVPEFQGAGVGMKFLEWVAERELRGEGYIGHPTRSIIHTAHPALAVTLRRSPRWRQLSGSLGGGSKKSVVGLGGHMRAVAGFAYYGERGEAAWSAKGAKRV